MTTVQQIQKAVKTLPDSAREEVLHFVLFLQTQTQSKITVPKKPAKKLRPVVQRALAEAEREWNHGEVQIFETSQDALQFLDDLVTKP